MLTNGSLQGVTILKDKILEDNTGVASHPDNDKSSKSLYFRYRLFYFIWFSETAGRRHGSADLILGQRIFPVGGEVMSEHSVIIAK